MAIKQKNNSLPFFRIGSTPRKKIYLGTNLVYSTEAPIPPPKFMQATGGTVTTDGDYKIHSFTTSGTFTISALGTDPTDGDKVQYLIVGGGGSGGSAGFSEFGAGGGGAGGLLTATGRTVTAQNYSITVGTGGNKVAAGRNTGNDGGSSIFDGLTAVGGGGGGSSNGGAGRNGGSGGGAGGLNGATTAGLATAGQGNNGGNQATGGDPYGGAGGGGASVGGGQSNGNGTGGNGTASSITGTSVTYAGGGSGGETFAPPFAAGTGGGGTGGILSTNGSNGTDGLGGGGGGGGNDGSGAGTQGGDGGDGVVILRYKYQ
jgi:hypothetical protein